VIRAYVRVLAVVCFGCCLMPGLTAVAGHNGAAQGATRSLWIKAGMLIVLAVPVTAVFYVVVTRLERWLDQEAREEAIALAAIPSRYLDLAIAAAAGLSLLLELAVIRWQATVFEFFSFYKNFGLLSCFVGLGVGYALARRDRLPLLLVLPLLVWQFGFMIVLRFGFRTLENIRALPFSEQLTMGLNNSDLLGGIVLYALLALVFVLTALTFIPVGQLCGLLMVGRRPLRAYGLNLAGSIAGVVLMLVASWLWTPPIAWFALCFLGVILFLMKRPAATVVAVCFAALGAITLTWPVNTLWNRVYSPYQLLEIGQSESSGLMLIRAAGFYFQGVYDLSPSRADPATKRIRDYYDFPYKARPGASGIAVVGAGSGNDVAAARRSGASDIDAVEIDPAILVAGRANHPEKPYSDPRVHPIVDDARSFLRRTNRRYDMIVYGLLDSHTLLSQGSSVRVDSFVYTVEGLREARARLKSDGLMSLSFSVLNQPIGRKIYLMMQQAFDGRPPVCVTAGYDNAVIFLTSNDVNWRLPPELLEHSGFADTTAHFADPQVRADVSTDDWPFFYMPRRVYPLSYLLIVVQTFVLSLVMIRLFVTERLNLRDSSFFFLGAGFMLIETKGITELGLTFGNTWQVIGVVITAILIMAFLGNLVVSRLDLQRPLVPYLCLYVTLALGWAIAAAGGFSSTALGRLAAAAILTCPMFFSGIVFSVLLGRRGDVSEGMAMNLLGAVCGALVEYNSMYFGFRSLYGLAALFYVLAAAASWRMLALQSE
jgi:hypothetical protein